MNKKAIFRPISMLLIAATSVFLSCERNPSPPAVTETKASTAAVAVPPSPLPPLTKRCFERSDKHGVTTLSLRLDERNKVEGKLLFVAIPSGVRVDGTLSGALADDVLRCIYTQRAQGKQYINERFFKIEKTGLLEGEGEQKQDAQGVFRYKNAEKVLFKRVLSSAPCN